jgi:hypothetical protein
MRSALPSPILQGLEQHLLSLASIGATTGASTIGATPLASTGATPLASIGATPLATTGATTGATTRATTRATTWNDLDMLETGCGVQCAHANGKEANMTDIEYKTEFSMWAISASPIQVTTRIMNCTNTSGPVTCSGWISDLHSVPATLLGSDLTDPLRATVLAGTKIS